MLLEQVLVEHPHRVPEHDRVRDLHHRRLDVQREQQVVLLAVLDLLLEERAQRLLAHVHAVDDLALEQRHRGAQDDGLAALGDEVHAHVAGVRQGHRFLAVVEVAGVHVRDVGARGGIPRRHRMRVLARVALDRGRRAPVRIALAQHRVHRAAEHLRILRLDRLFRVVLRGLGIVGDLVALRLQFLDGGGQLADRGADVGQLDDVGLGPERQLAEFREVVRDALRPVSGNPGNSPRMRAATEMSLSSTSTPAGLVKARRIGSRE